MQGVEKAKKVQLQSLRAEFETIKMLNSENIDGYVTRLKTVANEMRRNGEKVDDVRLIDKVLRSLTQKFDYVVMAIEEAKDLSQMTIDELVGSLRAHEQRMNRNEGTVNLEQALQSKLYVRDNQVGGSYPRSRENQNDYRDGYRGGYRGQGRGRGRGRQPFRRSRSNERYEKFGRGRGSRSRERGEYHKQRDKSQFRCYSYNKYGHFSYECRTPLKIEEKNHLATTKDDIEESAVFVTYRGNEKCKENIWYLDTGASNHMCG